ncbi:CypX cytochrome P450 [Pyrenophora tritici-repentis]|nr:CypX cytochrome P450 [Pyrenophora tritici-repentis]
MSWTVLFFRVPSLLHIFLPALIPAGIIGWIVYARYFHPLAKFPGPLPASVTRLWLICDVAKDGAEKTQARLHEQYAPNEVAIADPEAIDMAEWIQWYAFDVIGELFFSRKFGFMENAHDHEGYIHALDPLVPFVTVACAMPVYMRPLFLASGATVPRVFKALGALRHIETASDACVAQRRHDSTRDKAGRRSQGQKDMLDGFLHSKGEEKDFTLTEVKMEVYGMFIAGSDTTAAAITAILYHLVRKRSAYDKLTAEIDEATESGALSLPAVQYHEAVGLPYLVACCKEGTRLDPSVGLTLPRHVPAGGCAISGGWALTQRSCNATNLSSVRMLMSSCRNDSFAKARQRWTA